MSGETFVVRPQARRDVDEALVFYLTEADERVAMAFIDALEAAYRTLADHPQAGSTRYAHPLALPGLRSWSLDGFPYVIFYIEQDGRVDVWRLLHGARDIPASLEIDSP